MNRWIAVTSIIILLACTGCGDSHESITAEGLDVMKQMVAVYEGIKDEATATNAKPKLVNLLRMMDDISQRKSRLPAPTDEQILAIKQKYDKEIDETQVKFQEQMIRIAADQKICAVLKELGPGVKSPAN